MEGVGNIAIWKQHFSGVGLGSLPQGRRDAYKKQAPETYSDFLDLSLRWVEPGDLPFNISQLFPGPRVKVATLDPWRMGSEPEWGLDRGLRVSQLWRWRVAEPLWEQRGPDGGRTGVDVDSSG